MQLLKNIIHNSPRPLIKLIAVGIKTIVWIRSNKIFGDGSFNPLKTYCINPNDISYIVSQDHKFRVRESGKKIGGEWDIKAEQIEEHILYKSCWMRYKENMDWEKTPQYKHSLEKIKSGESAWHNCNSKEDIDNRCEYVDNICKSIKNKGYKDQYEIRGESNKYPYPGSLREISVAVSRHGEFILIDGRHRLFIAKILCLDEITIHISIIHEDFNGRVKDII